MSEALRTYSFTLAGIYAKLANGIVSLRLCSGNDATPSPASPRVSQGVAWTISFHDRRERL